MFGNVRLGVTYPILMETQEMKKTFDSFVVPYSYFVDSEGNMLGKSIAGSQSAENWESLIKEKLGQVK
ncbi:MAG: hypothetical protein IJG52_08285 [Lachnospiraceae bacterium]|nr:hypothetical protein [Lachnospiraceae bacterium]